MEPEQIPEHEHNAMTTTVDENCRRKSHSHGNRGLLTIEMTSTQTVVVELLRMPGEAIASGHAWSGLEDLLRESNDENSRK